MERETALGSGKYKKDSSKLSPFAMITFELKNGEEYPPKSSVFIDSYGLILLPFLFYCQII